MTLSLYYLVLDALLIQIYHLQKTVFGNGKEIFIKQITHLLLVGLTTIKIPKLRR